MIQMSTSRLVPGASYSLVLEGVLSCVVSGGRLVWFCWGVLTCGSCSLVLKGVFSDSSSGASFCLVPGVSSCLVRGRRPLLWFRGRPRVWFQGGVLIWFQRGVLLYGSNGASSRLVLVGRPLVWFQGWGGGRKGVWVKVGCSKPLEMANDYV